MKRRLQHREKVNYTLSTGANKDEEQNFNNYHNGINGSDADM